MEVAASRAAVTWGGGGVGGFGAWLGNIYSDCTRLINYMSSVHNIRYIKKIMISQIFLDFADFVNYCW